jgi:hypothetical protein
MPHDLEPLNVTSMADLLIQYGVAVLFVWAFAVQAGSWR